MDISLVPSLYHSTCSRLIVTIFNRLEVHKKLHGHEPTDYLYMPIYKSIKGQVKDEIPLVTPCTRLQEKLEVFIDPLLAEIEVCLDFFNEIGYGYRNASSTVQETIPLCWLSDGTIDREKLARFVAQNEDLDPANRFIFACISCCFSEALDLWNVLLKIEKAHLKLKSNAIVKLWIQWLESSSPKDWESFLAWSLGTPLWHSNVSILKHVLQTLSPEERSQYLLNALIEKDVDDDVMRFCMSVMTKDEKETIFREPTSPVFSFISSWPFRPSVKHRVCVLTEEINRENKITYKIYLQDLRRWHSEENDDDFQIHQKMVRLLEAEDLL